MVNRTTNPLLGGCPPWWSSEWGEDEFGVFVGFSIGGVDHRMRWIAPGSYMMGSPDDEEGRWKDEGQHSVVLREGFWLGETPVTQALWKAVMAEYRSYSWRNLRDPVTQVSWEDCQEFCARLGAWVPGMRLPHEAEWEYACRAGTTSARYGELAKIAWFRNNSDGHSQPVQKKQPNAWGLYDMLGNVYEWCMCAWHDYGEKQPNDPLGPEFGELRVMRGGAWMDDPGLVRAAYRFRADGTFRDDIVGFRLARGQD